MSLEFHLTDTMSAHAMPLLLLLYLGPLCVGYAVMAGVIWLIGRGFDLAGLVTFGRTGFVGAWVTLGILGLGFYVVFFVGVAVAPTALDRIAPVFRFDSFRSAAVLPALGSLLVYVFEGGVPR